jgi:predicted transport protein
MPLFQLAGNGLKPIVQAEFKTEKELQQMVERNLGPVFNCRFVASEFSTGSVHGGRIDTLAISEDNNPVIIEYKKVQSSDLVTQSLFYLSWLNDHRGDFQVAVQKALGPKVSIDWSEIRVICIAPSYKRYDLHAVQVTGGMIELWTYRRFVNGAIFFEEIQTDGFQGSSPAAANGKNPLMVAAGRKAAVTRATAKWTFAHTLDGKPETTRDLALAVQEFMLGLDPSIEEAPKKWYVAYRTTQNIVCMEVQKQKVLLFLKLDPKKCKGPPGISRDASKIGHCGTGSLQVTLRKPRDFEAAKPFLRRAYRNLGG